MRDVYADDLYLLSDREMGAADTWATAMTAATGIHQLEEEPDLVFAGFKTADGETGHTGPQTEWCLDMPLITHVISLEVDPDEERVRAKRLVEAEADEIETVEAPLPAFIVTDPEFEASYHRAEHRLEHKDLRETTRERADEFGEYLADDSEKEATEWDRFTMWNHADLNLDPDYIGLDGSPTIVAGVDPIPKAPSEREATPVDPDDEDDMERLIDELAPYAAGD
ncbi:electron transfer flavoprotein subunit beta, partial [Halobacteriales archaeon QH_1_68_42]